MQRYRQILLILVIPLAVTLQSDSSWAISDCIYAGVTFTDGAVSCQSGSQFRCSNGTWEALDLGCGNPPPTPTVEDQADCRCTGEELGRCAELDQACCVWLEAGRCTRGCCPRE